MLSERHGTPAFLKAKNKSFYDFSPASVIIFTSIFKVLPFASSECMLVIFVSFHQILPSAVGKEINVSLLLVRVNKYYTILLYVHLDRYRTHDMRMKEINQIIKFLSQWFDAKCIVFV